MSLPSLRVVRVAAPLRQQATDLLRGAIARGEFGPGDRLVERELCEMLGVSRPLVREAIRQLEAEGLVRHLPQRGIEVITLTAEEARQIYEVRLGLEGIAAAGFVQFANAAQRRKLASAAEAVAAAGAQGEPAKVQVEKSRFYATLLEGCGNPVLASVLASMQGRISLLRGTSLSEPGRLPDTVREIHNVHAAIAVGDPAAARAKMDEHISNAARVTLAALAAADAPAVTGRSGSQSR